MFRFIILKFVFTIKQLLIGFSLRNRIKTKYRSLLKSSTIEILQRIALHHNKVELKTVVANFLNKKKKNIDQYLKEVELLEKERKKEKEF